MSRTVERMPTRHEITKVLTHAQAVHGTRDAVQARMAAESGNA